MKRNHVGCHGQVPSHEVSGLRDGLAPADPGQIAEQGLDAELRVGVQVELVLRPCDAIDGLNGLRRIDRLGSLLDLRLPSVVDDRAAVAAAETQNISIPGGCQLKDGFQATAAGFRIGDVRVAFSIAIAECLGLVSPALGEFIASRGRCRVRRGPCPLSLVTVC